MRFLSVSTSATAAALLLASYAANAQTPLVARPPMQTAPASTAPATIQANPIVSGPMGRVQPAADNVPVGTVIDSTGDGAIPPLALEVQSAGSITYINGGIGDEEVSELKAKEKEFNVHVLVSAPQGEFISDVTLTVLDSKGTALLTVADAGPYFYAQLPPGAYTLEATANGEKKKISLTAPQKGAVKKQIVFNESGGITSPHHPTATVD